MEGSARKWGRGVFFTENHNWGRGRNILKWVANFVKIGVYPLLTNWNLKAIKQVPDLNVQASF